MALQDQLKEIAASVYIKPATVEELMEREFMKGKSEWGVHTLVNICFQKGWLYCKKGVYHTHKKFALRDVMSEYELDGIHEKPKRNTIEETVRNWDRGIF